jgi:cytochrome c
MALALSLVGVGAPSFAAETEPFDEGRLEKEVLASGLHDVIQLGLAANGDVYFVERAGALKRYSPSEKAARTLGTVPTVVGGEYGLIGLALDRDFLRNGWVYLCYAPRAEEAKNVRVSRFTVRDAALDLASEKILLSFPMGGGHQGGGLQMDGEGLLWIGLGDHANANLTPETDERPGRESFNALRTSANTQDLRGKILRIRPQPDGTYAIPPGNLFTDPKDGRPEIYVMGCRNPYRFFYDEPARTLYWGEIGSNTETRFGTEGYDEITRTRTPGNSGWPHVIGPNTPYRRFDHATNTLGDFYSPNALVNDSRLNTGKRDLPPAIPALIWYGSEDSKEFPELGNGGRSALAGPVYRYDAKLASDVKLPAAFDGRFFIYDWCRTWIKTVSFAANGDVASIAPFLGRTNFRRPIDLQVGPDGALYLLEFGEKWGGNIDGVLSRIIYRRGNRAPAAQATASVVAGVAPLQVRFSAAGSTDPDGDALSYTWTFGEKGASAEGREVTWTYSEKGVRTAALLVTDAHGASHRTTVTIAIGNAPTVVQIAEPRHGSFFDWGEKLPLSVRVEDREDGSTVAGSIAAAQVRVLWQYRDEPAMETNAVPQIGFDGGAAIMRRSDCLSCHQLASPSVGPTFLAIADRYRTDASAETKLIAKVRDGGAGAWGDLPMPAHPQHNADELREMTRYILALRPPEAGERIETLQGELATRTGPRNTMHEKRAGGRYVLTASYRDQGAPDAAPLTTETRAVIHARRTRAALFDASRAVTVMEVSTLRRDRRICAQLSAGSYLLFRHVNLAGIGRIACEVSAGVGHGGVLEFRADRPDGPLVGRVVVPETGLWDNWKTVNAEIRDPGGVRDLYVVAASGAEFTGKRLNVDVLEFVRAPGSQ